MLLHQRRHFGHRQSRQRFAHLSLILTQPDRFQKQSSLQWTLARSPVRQSKSA